MAGKLLLATLLVVLAAATLQSTHAAVYVVGNATGWQTPSDSNFYSNWEDGFNFMVGDILVFNFVPGSHDVAQVTESAYDSCNTTNPLSLVRTAPVNITLNTTGDHYFICTFSDHCSKGQKLDVSVVGANGTSSPGPSGTPGSNTPTTPGSANPPPPPPPSSASSLVATFSVIFLSFAVVLLC